METSQVHIDLNIQREFSLLENKIENLIFYDSNKSHEKYNPVCEGVSNYLWNLWHPNRRFYIFSNNSLIWWNFKIYLDRPG